MAKSYSSSAILKHLKAGTECACLAVFETCRFRPLLPQNRSVPVYMSVHQLEKNDVFSF